MSCLCREIAGPNAKLSEVCIGNWWVFQNLDVPERQAIGEKALRKAYRVGDVVFRQGQSAELMFLIKAGRVKLSKITEDGMEMTLDIRQAGDFLGENMLNDQAEFPVSAVCLEDTLICGFTKGGFEDLVTKHPKIGLQVIKNLSARIDWLTSRVGSMSLSSLEQRLYQVLVQVAKEHGRKQGQSLILPMPFTHEDLSFLVGAHRVSITRAIKELKKNGRLLQEGKTLILPLLEVA